MVRKKGPDFVKLSRIRPDVRGDTTLSTLASRLGRVGSEGSPRILAWAMLGVAGVLLVGDLSVAKTASGSLGDDPCPLGEAQQARRLVAVGPTRTSQHPSGHRPRPIKPMCRP